MDNPTSTRTAKGAREVTPRVGEKIRSLRTKLGLTQAQLAGTELSTSYVSAIERGKIRPASRALYFIAKRMNVTTSFLTESPESYVEAESTSNSGIPIEEET
jgi:HTH-type transcriptional regulator, quorum sensing regulator NprR